MTPNLPQVVEFSSVYDVRVEPTEGGGSRVVARLKQPKHPTSYKRFHDLPFCDVDANQKWHFWWFDKSSNWVEQQERGKYFWNEFVRYVRGPQKKRRADAMWNTKELLGNAIHRYPDGSPEASVFIEHLAEALISHLRVGLDEAMPETKP